MKCNAVGSSGYGWQQRAGAPSPSTAHSRTNGTQPLVLLKIFDFSVTSLSLILAK